MRKVLLFLFITSFVYAQNVSVKDYEVAVSRAKNLRFDGNWNWSQIGDSVSTNLANAYLFFRTFYSSLPLAWFVDVDANGFKNKSNLGHIVRLQARFNKYVWTNADAFGFSELNASHTDTSKQIASDITVGFGYGRYINATSLAKAVRIEDHLLRDKIISGYLPKEIMLDIANIIEREEEFRVMYGEIYETYWFDAIEDEIKKSHQLIEENVGSIGILRMRQVLFNINERVNQRFYGWDATAGVLFPLSTADGGKVGNPNLSLGGRYSLPLSWQFQVNAIARVFTPLDSSFAKRITSSLGVDFIYELSNKINFVTNYTISAFKPEGNDAVITHNLGSSFWFYLENNIFLTVTGNFTRLGRNRSILSSNIGLQYNLF